MLTAVFIITIIIIIYYYFYYYPRLFYCVFFVCSLFVNDFSTTSGPIHAKVCMRAYSGSGCVFSPFGGYRPPGAEKGGNEIFATIGVNGKFLHFGGF